MQSIINTLVDSVQQDVVSAIVGTAVTGFFAFLTFVANRVNIKVTEHFNREAVELGANRFANSIIDEIQRRYLNAGEGKEPDIADLVTQGVQYIRRGNPDAIRQGKLSDNNLRTTVAGAIKSKATDALGEALNNILMR